MTILEMLDRLEAEIRALRERVQLPAETGVAKRPRAKRRKVDTRKREKPRQLELAAAQAAGEARAAAEDKPLLGKRQALGRSLLHLRKLSQKN